MQIQLTPQIESIVKELLATGDYHDQDEVTAEAIILLEAVRPPASLADAEGEIASGDYVLWTPELRAEIRREARQLVNEGRKPHPDVCP